MKKKYKVKHDKKAKETRVNYIGLNDPESFRSTYIKTYMERYDKCVLSINTNIIDKEIDPAAYIKDVENVMMAISAPCEVIPTPNSRDRKVMGITMGKQKGKAFLLLAEMDTSKFLEYYDQLFKKIDYMVGFGLTEPFEEVVKVFRYEYDKYLIDHDGFEHTLYDSYVIKSLRTSFEDFPDVDAK